MLKKREILGELFSSFGKGNISMMSIPGKRVKKGTESLLKEMITENSQSWERN